MFKGKIPTFTLYSKKPNEIHFGSLYTKEISIPFSQESKRTLRVWLPENYDGKKAFGVLYMCDGQNIVDKYTSAYGEWNMEDHINNLQKEGYDGLIVVGIDCPKYPPLRMAEYSLRPFTKNTFDDEIFLENYGNKFADYIVNVIKPMIDEHFNTNPKYTGFCGSSMGGLFSFEIAKMYPEIFDFALCFSPAFCLYKRSELRRLNKEWNPKPSIKTKFVFYSGGKDEYESLFIKDAKKEAKFLLKQGFSDSQVIYIFDKNELHHESAWSKYVEPSLKFCLKK